MTYWTKPIFEIDKISGMRTPSGQYESIKFFDEDWVPDGDGFAVDIGNIEYSDYLINKDQYKIENGKLIKVS